MKKKKSLESSSERAEFDQSTTPKGNRLIQDETVQVGRVYIYIYILEGVDVVEWSRALEVRLSEWCCSVTMVWVQIPSREGQKFESSKI